MEFITVWTSRCNPDERRRKPLDNRPRVGFAHTSKDSQHAICPQRYLVQLGAITIYAIASLSAAHAQGSASEQKAIEERQALFKEIDKAFKPVGEMLKKKQKYDAAVVQQSVAALQPLAAKIPDAFALDTHKATGDQNQSAREHLERHGGFQRERAKRW